MRLFVAIKLNENMKAAFINAQDLMYESGVRGNYCAEDNLHLTLAFIGEYPDADYVINALQTVSFTPFQITSEEIGSFGDLWWAGISDNPALQAVVRRVRRALAQAKIPYDKKPFRPHITLIRKARTDNGIPATDIEGEKMCVNSISLMKSDRGKNGMIYTEIGKLRAEQ